MSKVFHASLHGLSSVKERELSTLDLTTTQWSHLDIESSNFYLFIPQNSFLRQEYDRYWKVTDIFPVNSVGMQTHRDYFITDMDIDVLTDRIRLFRDSKLNDEQLRKAFDLGSLNIAKGRSHLCGDSNWADRMVKCLWRPFDTRNIYYDKNLIDRPRARITDPLLKDNLALLAMRQIALQSGCSHFLATNVPAIDRVFYSNKGAASVFPLYLETESDSLGIYECKRYANISAEFIALLNRNLNYTPTPEDIFHYIYAIFHSPTYRSRYAEFLKIDFPRVPLTRNVDLFRQLGELGQQLVNLHLMKSPILNQTSSPFIDNGGSCIVDAGHPKYENGKVVINKQKDGFMDVPEAVWNFHVGGYQVCHKWLKDRKGRTLSQDDIEHYQKIVVALGQSIDLMAKIDAAIPNWPIDAEYN
jgi:hypothetical protein